MKIRQMDSPGKKIILFIFLAVVTMGCHFFIDQYERIGPEMLGDHWTMHAPESGRAGVVENELRLFSLDIKKSVSIQQEILSFDQGSIVNLSADMKCEKIRPGAKPYNLARLLLVQHDGQKDRWNLPHLVASFIETHGWDNYSQFFTIGLETKKLKVVALLSQSTGSFWLKNLRLYPVSQTQVYTWIKTGILVAWTFFAVFLLGSCFFYGNQKIVVQGMLVLAFIAIIIGTTMPVDMKSWVSKQVVNQIHTAGDAFSDRFADRFSATIEPAIVSYLSKAGHFCFFVLFGLALSLLLSRESAILVMTHILLLAGATELAQFYIDGRSPLVWDFIIDASGGLFGILLMKSFPIVCRSTDKVLDENPG
jgi:VanZ family protein